MIYWSFGVAHTVMWTSVIIYPALLHELMKRWGIADRTRTVVTTIAVIGLLVLLWPTMDFISDIGCRHFEHVPCDEVEYELP
jgi:hypothetical protein